MAKRVAELIILRNEFYLRSYDQIKKVTLVLALISILLIYFAIRQHERLKPTPRYFPTTPDGRLIAMPPVDINHLLLKDQKINPETGVIIGMPQPIKTYAELEPAGENALVLYWTYMAVRDMFDYDYVHYRASIQESSKYFTALGHNRFIEALVSSKNLEAVKARSAVVIPEIVGDIKLKNTYMVEGHYAWDLEVPLRLTYASLAVKQPLVQNLLAKLSVARVSTLQSPFYGLAIYRLNFEQVFNLSETTDTGNTTQ